MSVFVDSTRNTQKSTSETTATRYISTKQATTNGIGAGEEEKVF